MSGVSRVGGADEGLPPADAEAIPELEGPLADVALVDLLNRVLDRGVVVAGDVTVSVAGVDLLHLDLRLLLSSAESLAAHARRDAPSARREGSPNGPHLPAGEAADAEDVAGRQIPGGEAGDA